MKTSFDYEFVSLVTDEYASEFNDTNGRHSGWIKLT